MQAAFTAGRKGGQLWDTKSTNRSAKAKTAAKSMPGSMRDIIPAPSLYLSLHLTLSFLLIFSFAFLPRTNLLFSDTPISTPTQRTSQDRPEHPFMTAITADPARAMNYEVVGVWVCMVWWGGWMRSWWNEEKVKKGEMKRDVGKGGALETVERRKAESRKKLIDFRNAILTTLATTLLLHVIIILFGAPLTNHHRKTFLLALHLAMLIVHPLVYALGLPGLYEGGSFDRYRLRRLLSELDLRTPLERATVYPIAFALVGTWIGVIPLALDWDRPWQAWPLPPAFGSLVGYAVGGLLAWGRGVVEEVERQASLASEAERIQAGNGSGSVSVGKGKKSKKTT